MITLGLAVSALVLGQAAAIEEPHRKNELYRALLERGVTLGGRRVDFSTPLVADGATADDERKALREIAGSERAVAEFIRDSISAPFVLKVLDETAKDGSPIRRARLWFAVRADLESIDPNTLAKPGTPEKPVEAGNMKFSGHILTSSELSSRGRDTTTDKGDIHSWYVHLTGRLLGRIDVEATDRVIASRSPRSMAVASRTDPKSDDDGAFPNRWRPIERQGSRDVAGPPHRYDGGAGLVKISRLTSEPGVLLVDSQFAFLEPRAWFDGAPILRSKISLIAQDQIRRLRRELKSRQTPR